MKYVRYKENGEMKEVPREEWKKMHEHVKPVEKKKRRSKKNDVERTTEEDV